MPLLVMLLLMRVPFELAVSPAKATTATPMLLPLMLLLLTVAVPWLEEDALEAVALQGVAADLAPGLRMLLLMPMSLPAPCCRPATVLLLTMMVPPSMTGAKLSMRMPVAWLLSVGSGVLFVYSLPVIVLPVMVAVAPSRPGCRSERSPGSARLPLIVLPVMVAVEPPRTRMPVFW